MGFRCPNCKKDFGTDKPAFEKHLADEGISYDMPVLARRNPRELRGVLRRYAVRYWLWAMQMPRWRVYKQEYRFEVLKCAMKMLEKYVISGRMPLHFRVQGAANIMGWLLYTAKKKVIWNCNTDSLPIE